MLPATTLPQSDPPPPQLLLTRFCSVSLPASSLDPRVLSLSATEVTTLLREILSHEGYPHPPRVMPAPGDDLQDHFAEMGHWHGGLND